MTGIPADIMEKAFEIVEAMSSNKHDALTAGDSRYANMLTDDANAVAMAIIAERQRCANVAKAHRSMIDKMPEDIWIEACRIRGITGDQRAQIVRSLLAERRAADKAKADADLCAKEWQAEIAANNILRAQLREAVEALQFYTGDHEPGLLRPNEGPWGVNSDDFGNRAREALRKMGEVK